jgi:hypothetical protein
MDFMLTKKEVVRATSFLVKITTVNETCFEGDHDKKSGKENTSRRLLKSAR